MSAQALLHRLPVAPGRGHSPTAARAAARALGTEQPAATVFDLVDDQTGRGAPQQQHADQRVAEAAPEALLARDAPAPRATSRWRVGEGERQDDQGETDEVGLHDGADRLGASPSCEQSWAIGPWPRLVISDVTSADQQQLAG